MGYSNGAVQVRPESPNRRADYRVHYPAELRPSMRVGQSRYEVLDVSEQGLRFGLPPGGPEIQVGDLLQAEVHFHAGLGMVAGKVVRVERETAAARLVCGLGFKAVAREFEWVMEYQA